MKRYMLRSLAIAAIAGVLYLPLDAVMFAWHKLKGATQK